MGLGYRMLKVTRLPRTMLTTPESQKDHVRGIFMNLIKELDTIKVKARNFH